MASSSNPIPVPEGDGTLRLKRRERHDKSALRQFVHHTQIPRDTKDKYVTKTASIKDEDNPPLPGIPDLNLSGAMNPALVFGIQVSALISRDRAILEEKAELGAEFVSPDSTISQRKKALKHAKVVAQQLGKRSSKSRPNKGSDLETEIFRFTDLPPEIRDMIYKIYFTNSSGKKLRLLLAFKINGVKVKGGFYNAAEKVYYPVNNWNFSIRDCLKNSVLRNMDQFHVEMIRRMTIQIPIEIRAYTKLSKVLFRAVNINDLTLSTFSEAGVRRAIHEILPRFKQLRRITLRIQYPKERHLPLRRNAYGIEFYKMFRDVKAMFDRVLCQEGGLIQENAEVQEWGWQTDGEKAFKIACLKKHIKFE